MSTQEETSGEREGQEEEEDGTVTASLLSEKNDPNSLKLPYRPHKCESRLNYQWTTFLVTHPRIHSLFLLWRGSYPRLLVFFDIYTDATVAYSLYSNNESFLFMLSSLLIATPFIVIWSSSLRFVQRFLSKHNINENWHPVMSLLFNICLFLYILPPIGAFLMFFIEIGWIIKDVKHTLKSFINGSSTILIESNDNEWMALKAYRRGISM